MYIWTNREIEKILIQLDKREKPFKRYALTVKKGALQLLGRGGFALVYKARARTGGSGEYAMKVIGFGEKHVDPVSFEKSVSAQMDLGLLQQNIVKIYDHTDILVQLDDNNDVVRVLKEGEETGEGNCLSLMFLVMEKLQPILLRDKSGKTRLAPERLDRGDPKEIQKLAYDIGKALSLAHGQNILHRDVKPENIFYTEAGGHYKLGDFGIAKVTDDGMASTVAFTKGYGAPEVIGSLEEQYDSTADIYSFGMLLYVLSNGLKFPGSDSYSVNSGTQYQQGYILPPPLRETQGLWPVIEKMCRYDPDERYQSVDEALDDVENLIFHVNTHYQREHRTAVFAVGVLAFFLGVIAWKLTFRPERMFELPKTAWLLLILSVGKWILKLFQKKVQAISAVIAGIGVYFMAAFGFSWLRLALLIGITLSSGNFAGLFAGAVLILHAVSLVTGQNRLILENSQDCRWVAVTLLSLAVVTMIRYIALNERDNTLTAMYLKKDRYWIMVFVLYGLTLLYGICIKGRPADMCGGLLGERLTGELQTYGLEKAGGVGLCIQAAWMVREKFLSRFRRFTGTVTSRKD